MEVSQSVFGLICGVFGSVITVAASFALFKLKQYNDPFAKISREESEEKTDE